MTKYIPLDIYNKHGYDWHKASTKTDSDFDVKRDTHNIIRWCNLECSGRWSGTLKEMLFESKEDKVKFVLRWG